MKVKQRRLEQLERLRSEITHTHPPPWLPILGIHIRSQVETRQSQSYKFLKIAKNSNFEINFTHANLLKLLDKMYKYEMDPTRTVGATERTRDAWPTDRWRETNIPPPPRGYKNAQLHVQNHSISILHNVYGVLDYNNYCQTSNISCTLVANKLVHHLDVVGASPVCAAPTTS